MQPTCQAVNGVHGFGERPQPTLVDHLSHNLVDHCVPQVRLGRKVVVKGPFGDAGASENAIEARGLKAAAIDFRERRFKQKPPSLNRISVSRRHEALHTNQYLQDGSESQGGVCAINVEGGSPVHRR